MSLVAEAAELEMDHKVPHTGLVSGDNDKHTSVYIQIGEGEEKGLSKQQK